MTVHSWAFLHLQVRKVVSDFAVIISVAIMVGVDAALKVGTPKLNIPNNFQPTNAGARGWLIPPLGKNPWWTMLAASIPALLTTILVFMDQQITAVIVNKREHKLRVCTLVYLLRNMRMRTEWTDCIMGKILKKVEIGNFVNTALKSILKLVKLQSLVAKRCKMWKM